MYRYCILSFNPFLLFCNFVSTRWGRNRLLILKKSSHLEFVWLQVNLRAPGVSCITGFVSPTAKFELENFLQFSGKICSNYPNIDIVICDDSTGSWDAFEFSVNIEPIKTIKEPTLITGPTKSSVIDHYFTDLPDCTRFLGSSWNYCHNSNFASPRQALLPDPFFVTNVRAGMHLYLHEVN